MDKLTYFKQLQREYGLTLSYNNAQYIIKSERNLTLAQKGMIISAFLDLGYLHIEELLK